MCKCIWFPKAFSTLATKPGQEAHSICNVSIALNNSLLTSTSLDVTLAQHTHTLTRWIHSQVHKSMQEVQQMFIDTVDPVNLEMPTKYTNLILIKITTTQFVFLTIVSMDKGIYF